ncbi:MAG: hypothetical protein O3B86_10345 [Planctomycetota bacterium]|nr:hypothetical protein [Planctomycetota bacterium]
MPRIVLQWGVAKVTGLRLCRTPGYEIWRVSCFCGTWHDVSTDRDTGRVFDELECWAGQMFVRPSEEFHEERLWLDISTGVSWPLNVLETPGQLKAQEAKR